MNITSITNISLDTREKNELLDEIQRLFNEDVVNDRDQPRLGELMRSIESTLNHYPSASNNYYWNAGGQV